MNYAIMFRYYNDQRLLDISQNVLNLLRSKVSGVQEAPLALRGMYATEELKSRGYEDTVQDLIADIAEKRGLFNA